jgi:acetyl esterase/lipase
MDRRRLLGLGASAALASMLPACSRDDAPTASTSSATMGDVKVLTYGDDPEQKAELHRPASRSHGVVVVLHGGFWRAPYGFSLGRPLAESLTRRGWTVLNLEYRRAGNGGGFPETFDDVSAGIDQLADVDDLDTSRVITLGHSAGGQLAVWAAGRPKLDDARWSNPRVPVTAAVSQAGVLDLRSADEDRLGDGAVEEFIGTDRATQDLADPLARVPLDVPVWCIHGRDDLHVPIEQSQTYVRTARAAGARAALATVEGDHFSIVETTGSAWTRTLEILDEL